jgi:hypothetical protein
MICYVYLEDIHLEDISFEEHKAKSQKLPPTLFGQSRWFTRGWTLQELIAPPIVEFYTTEWVEIGTKASLSANLSNITGVPIPILRGEDPSTCTVAYRMFWASKRQTTRVDDTAYCLLGLFGVNMPMIYGEGSRAFQRLQEEIMKQNEDYTLFAWSLQYDCSPSLAGVFASSPADFSESVPTNLQRPTLHHHAYQLRQIREYTGMAEAEKKKLLAEMAEDPIPTLPYEISYKKGYDRLTFVNPLSLTKNNSPIIIPPSFVTAQDPPQVTGRGLRINLPLKLSNDLSLPSMAWIYCFSEGRPVCIFVDNPNSTMNLFARRDPSWLVTVTPD